MVLNHTQSDDLISWVQLKGITRAFRLISVYVVEQGRSQDFSLGEGGGTGRESTGDGAVPPPRKKMNFSIKMVSSGAFWVTISYRLAACFISICSTCRTEIYWRSFRHFGNYNDSLGKILRKKMTKIGQKIDKNCTKLRCFKCTFSVSILFKIFAVGGWGGARPPEAPPPAYAPAS